MVIIAYKSGKLATHPIYLNLSRLTIPNVPECSSQNPNPTPNLTPFEKEDSFAEETISISCCDNATIRREKFRTIADVVRMRIVNLPEDLPSGP